MSAPAQAASKVSAESKDNDALERVKARAGLWAVVASDAAITAAVIVALFLRPAGGELTPLLTSAFTAITAISTAYFGIKAVTNTADAAIRKGDEGRHNPDDRKGQHSSEG